MAKPKSGVVHQDWLTLLVRRRWDAMGYRACPWVTGR